ncbi:MAG TPA: hypothetical protein VGP65_07780 [Candidatus Angelobacter sp.]|nr:hypothetical protein [Candidatus Angelobacter sp.]
MKQHTGRLVMLMFALCLGAVAQQPNSSSMPGMQPADNSDHPMQHEHEASMSGMDMGAEVSALPSFHASSGTAWQPASVPETVWMFSPDGWDLMLHGVVFATYNHQGGPRGEGKAESVNYLMSMEQHRLGSGTILFRQMFSAESLTSPHPGFPLLFQTGETYHGQPLVDHQHPHNVFAELSALYTLPISQKVSWLLYGGPSAEPALGPVTYIHRESASENPAAPLGHHLQDSTHTSFGVVTTGFIFDFSKLDSSKLNKIGSIKLEGSAFNGHEPNEQRWSIQLGALDSWSFRASDALTRNWVAQYSYGRLLHPEALDPNNELRQTASLEYNRALTGGKLGNGNWATSLIWGRKHKELDNTTQNSYLLESTLNFLARNYAYTRLELVDKDELFPEAATHPAYRIGAYTFGGVRDLLHSEHWQVGLGGDVTFYSKPAVLDPVYGNNPVSFHVFLRVRPGLMEHQH